MSVANKFFLVCLLGGCALAGGSALAIPLRIQSPAAAQAPGVTPPGSESDPLRVSSLFEQVAARVGPAVVAVEATYPSGTQNPVTGKRKVVEESGSGFVVSFPNRPGYFVLTNNHVIAYARAEQITLRLADSRIVKPARVWTDPESDVAVLGLGGDVGRLPTLTLGDSDRVKVGQYVLAIGSPFGLNQTVTHGIISARERGEVSLGSTIRIKDFLQTDAAINPGSSGGPLVDLRGEVVGINTAIASHSNSSSGVAFSIPVNLVRRVGVQLLDKGAVARGYLGMQLARSFEPQDALKLGLDRVQGAWVERVFPGTPAADAGLRANDVILRVDVEVIRNENHMINLITRMPAGRAVRLYVWRQGQVVTLQAVVGDWNKAQNRFQAP
jgi:S1-C subfamily serine protease